MRGVHEQGRVPKWEALSVPLPPAGFFRTVFGLGPCPKGNGTEFFLELVGTSVLPKGTTVVPRRVGSSREAVELIRRAQHGVLGQGRKFMPPFRVPGEDLSSKTCTSRSAVDEKEHSGASNSSEMTRSAANSEDLVAE